MGKADNPLKRWRKHCYADKNNPHKSRWVAELRALGLTPELEILEEVPFDQWEEIEREYIRVFRMVGIRLTNLSVGGETPPMTGRKHSPETILKMQKSHSGYKHSEAACQKVSAALMGNKYALGNKTRLGCKLSLETRKKISDAGKGRRVSEGTRKKLSESGKVGWVERKAGAICS